MKIWPENCKIQNSKICQIQQILLKMKNLEFHKKTSKVRKLCNLRKTLKKMQIEVKFNKIKIMLIKVKSQQKFEKIKTSQKVQIWCKIKIQQILKKIQTKFKHSKSLEKILKISNFHKIVKIQQILIKY